MYKLAFFLLVNFCICLGSRRVSRSPAEISVAILETFRENVIDEDIKKLRAFAEVDKERKAAIAMEKQATNQAQQKARQSQEKTRQAAENMRKMQEQQKRQGEELQKKQRKDLDDAAKKNQVRKTRSLY